ncbi:MAG: c-type cytochrome biogenesis protein CcsB [Candidatus Rifleibacteriota bacterium]
MNETVSFTLAMICYIMAFVLYSIAVSFNKNNLYYYARYFIGFGIVFALFGLGYRWQAAGHPPLSNMYESLVCLSTFIAIASFSFTFRFPVPLLEAGSAVGAVLMIGIASVFTSEIRPLIPALQSYWLHLHVSLAFVGEACFALAFILSYMYCFRQLLAPETAKQAEIKEKGIALLVVAGLPVSFLAGMIMLYFHLRQHPMYQNRANTVLLWVLLPISLSLLVLAFLTYLFRGAIGSKTEKWLPSSQTLDNLTYRAIALGYPLFTVGGLIFGMVWANKAWGRYWGWDPKETWALITFLVYSAYLHVRLTRGWKGTWTACISVLGFIVTMFTLFGVNLLVSSLHSYAGI